MNATTPDNSIAPVPRLALTIREAGEAVSLSPRTVEELIRVGELRVKRVGRRVLVPVASLERWLAEQADSQSEKDNS